MLSKKNLKAESYLFQYFRDPFSWAHLAILYKMLGRDNEAEHAVRMEFKRRNHHDA